MNPKFTGKPDKAIVIGTSAGGVHALKQLLGLLGAECTIPIIVVIHRLKNVESKLADVLRYFSQLTIKEAEEKEELALGTVYLAPSNYHLMLEEDSTLSLNLDERVNFSRPSIDVTLVSFSEVYKDSLVSIILTGANADGAYGLKVAYENGGTAIVQKPEEAQVPVMPTQAIKAVPSAQRMSIAEIAKYLTQL